MLMPISQKQSDAQLQRELLEEKLNKMQSFIEMQEGIKKNQKIFGDLIKLK